MLIKNIQNKMEYTKFDFPNHRSSSIYGQSYRFPNEIMEIGKNSRPNIQCKLLCSTYTAIKYYIKHKNRLPKDLSALKAVLKHRICLPVIASSIL